MLINWKRSPILHLDYLLETETAVSIVLACAVAAIAYFIFYYLYYRRKVLHKDYRLLTITREEYFSIPLPVDNSQNEETKIKGQEASFRVEKAKVLNLLEKLLIM